MAWGRLGPGERIDDASGLQDLFDVLGMPERLATRHLHRGRDLASEEATRDRGDRRSQDFCQIFFGK